LSTTPTKEELYDTIAELAPVAVYKIKLEGPRFEWVNDQMCRVLGYSEEELLKMNPFDLLDEDGKSVFVERTKKRLAGEKLGTIDFKIKKRDGHVLWACLRIKPVIKKGVFDGALVVAHDITERKKAEEALRESEALHRTLFDNSYDGFILLEPMFNGKSETCDFRFLKVNRAYERQTGRKANAVEGKMAKEVAPDLEQEWISLVGKVVKSGKAVRCENYNARTNRWYDAHYFPYAENKVGIFFRDVTERKEAERSLINKKQELNTILDSSPTIIFYKDKDGKIIQANRAFAEALNVSRESLLGKTVFDLYSDEIAQAMTNDDLEVMASKCSKRGIVEPYESPTGIRWIRTDKTPSFDENGKVTGLIGFSEEVTERKKAEEDLRRQASLIDLSPDAIIVITVEGIITFWNKGAEKLYGWTGEEAVGKNIHVLLETVFPQALEEILLELKDGKNWTGELTHRTKEGDQVIVQSRWLGEVDKNGEIANILESNTDITKRKVLEKQVKDSERLATIGKTARMVGHDIRNPLQAIAGDVFLLDNDVASLNESEVKESMLDSVKGIKDNLFYIAKIVDDLQDYSRQLEPVLEKVSVEKLFDEVMLNVADCSCHKVVIDVPKGFPEITSDFSILKRALTNLVQNAIQAMPKGGKLTLTVAKRRAKVMISVEDTGVGIPEEVKPKLFAPMVSTKAKGQGLGLAVVKRLVEALEGEITFESQVGKGTKFTVGLPIE
jgi:PAS domain S-box-containing protein